MEICAVNTANVDAATAAGGSLAPANAVVLAVGFDPSEHRHLVPYLSNNNKRETVLFNEDDAANTMATTALFVPDLLSRLEPVAEPTLCRWQSMLDSTADAALVATVVQCAVKMVLGTDTMLLAVVRCDGQPLAVTRQLEHLAMLIGEEGTWQVAVAANEQNKIAFTVEEPSKWQRADVQAAGTLAATILPAVQTVARPPPPALLLYGSAAIGCVCFFWWLLL